MLRLARKVGDYLSAHQDAIATGLSVWLGVAFVGMFLEKWFPFLRPFVLWTFRIYLGSLAAFSAALLVVAPGVLMAKELQSSTTDREASIWEKRMTSAWCAGAGVIFTSLIAAAYLLQVSGRVVDIKLWFISLCFVLVMIPYAMVGFLVRWSVFRRHRNGKCEAEACKRGYRRMITDENDLLRVRGKRYHKGCEPTASELGGSCARVSDNA